MKELDELIKHIKAQYKLIEKDYESYNLVDSKRFYLVENDRDDEPNEKLIIYDCRNRYNEFEFTEYMKMREKEILPYTPIMIFNNWDSEKKFYFKTLEALNKAKDKRNLKNIFDEKVSVYSERKDIITFNIEDESNYLDYTKDNEDDLKGYIFNISLSELKKLFNITGQGLFKDNVRKGNVESKEADELKEQLAYYIYSYVYKYMQKNMHFKELKEQDILELFSINKEIVNQNSAESFWFKHNGITIFCFEESNFSFIGSQISVDPSNVSVINGAQTLTNFYTHVVETEKRLIKFLEDKKLFSKEIEEDVRKCFYEICEKHYVKSIFILGNEDTVKPITNGLNNQIPILKEHMLADSDQIDRINSSLKGSEFKIQRIGEKDRYGMPLIDFTKKYLILTLKPGTSKNFRKDDLEDVLNDIEKAMSDNQEKLTIFNGLMMISQVEKWWRETKEERKNYSETVLEKTLNSYAKNYFESYLAWKSVISIADEDIDVYYSEFVTLMEKIEQNPSVADFKKDELFERLIKFDLNKKVTLNRNELDLEELKNYLNNNSNNASDKECISRYSISRYVSKFIHENNLEFSNFRIVTLVNGKCTEQFPFSSSTFIELYSIDEDEIKKYEDSRLKVEIEKEFNLLIINRFPHKNSKIESINLIKNFSFREYDSNAKKVYEKTRIAFEKGDVSLFPKVGDDMKFHVRPKAKDGNDTFEFSDGTQITKRTFWANKSTVEELISKVKRF